MQLRITGDSNEESGVSEVIYELSGPTRKYFASKDYGVGLQGIGVILMCRDPALNFKRRIRHSKKDSMIYMDIMLDLQVMRKASPEERKCEVARRLFDEVPEVMFRYKLPDFNRDAFIADFQEWVESIDMNPRANQ